MISAEEKRQVDRDYRKNLGEIYRARQRKHFKKYYTGNREKIHIKQLLYREVKKMEGRGILKSAGNVSYVKQAISPNGATLRIFASNKDYFFQLTGFARALGYSQFNLSRTNLSAALDVNNSDSFLYYGFNKSASKGHDKTYLINFADVENVLNRLIRLVNSVSASYFRYEQKNREVQFEAQRLIEWFNEKILPEFLPHLAKPQTEEIFAPLVTNTPGKEFWARIVEKCRDDKYLYAVLKQAKVKDIVGDTLTLGFKSQTFADFF